MSVPTIINVQISGPRGSGKTTVLAKIRRALETEGYYCTSPDLASETQIIRHNYSDANLDRQKTVILLSEENSDKGNKA